MGFRFATASLRSLGIFRIALGITTIVDLVRRSPHITFLYSNQGIWSNHWALFSANPSPPSFSLLYALSQPWEVKIFFLLVALAALSFTLGYRTRLSQAITLLGWLSIINRNVHLMYAADSILLVLWFWGLFLPLGAVFSFDSRKKKIFPENASIRSFAISGLYLQIAVIYLFSAINKNGSLWADGQAVFYTLCQERIVSEVGAWFRDNLPFGMLRGLTYGTLVFELLVPILILSPVNPRLCKKTAAVIIVLLHWSIALCLNLGLFPLVTSTAALFLFFSVDSVKVSQVVVPKGPLAWSRESFCLLSILVLGWLTMISNRAAERAVQLPAPKWLTASSHYLSLYEAWNMFSPDPPIDDYVLIADATLSNGSHIDLFTGTAPKLDFNFRRGTWWDQSLDNWSRFQLGKDFHPEIERWVRERQGGVDLPKGQKIVQLVIHALVRSTPNMVDRQKRELVPVKDYIGFSLKL